jgi:hypothetical protein
MSVPYQFSIRDAGLVKGDNTFIISAFDASIPYLQSIGSQARWGSTPFSQLPGWAEETQKQIRESNDTTGALHILILEAELLREQASAAFDPKDMHSRVSDDGRRFVSVGFAFVRENWFPSYLPAAAVPQAQQLRLEDNLYVEVMVSDARTKHSFRGGGAALLQELQNYGRSREKKALYLDGWAGNERKLIRSVSPP